MSRRVSLHDVQLPRNTLKGVDLERMGKLSEDEGAFMEFLDNLDLEDLKKAQQKRQDMSDQVLQTAVINCDKEPAFEEKKTQLREKVLQMTDLKNDHNKRYEELKTLISKGDHQSVLKDLQKSLRDIEKLSEELADSFTSGSSEMDSDAFVADFREKRMLYWLRKIKTEKMEQLIKNMRPVPAPRSPRPTKPAVPPPYLAPMLGSVPQTSPLAQSLPPSTHQPPYPAGPHPTHSIPPQPDPRRMSNPTHSMPPYHPQMPMPPQPQPVPPHGHPFPAAAFTRYPGVPTGYPPPQRAPRPPYPYGGYPANAY